MSELKPYQTQSHRTHGYSADYPKLYNVWSTMLSRCYNTKREKYKDYGLRGVCVCPEWQRAESFCKWALENGYEDGLQIDRIDNNGNYEPSNCRWVTPKQNSRNRRNTKYLTVGGVTRCVAEWSETLSVNKYTIYWWIKEKGIEYAEQRLSEIARMPLLRRQ